MILKPFNDSKITNAKTDKERNGYLNEKQTAYLIDFEFKDYKKCVVLHDVRFEYNGRVAQIDHLLIDHAYVSVIESKLFNGSLEIGEDSWIVDYGKTQYSIPSPVLQNKRHIAVLKEIFEKEDIFPKGRFVPKFINAVVVSNKTIIKGKRPDELVYADSFTDWEKKARWKYILNNPMVIFGAAFKDFLSADELIASANRLMKFCTNCEPEHGKPTAASIDNPVEKMEKPQNVSPILERTSLLGEMKSLRIELANEHNAVMLHHVFNDHTLEEFDLKRPRTKEEMLRISGVGEVKYERYGTRFMRLWCPDSDASLSPNHDESKICKKCGSPMVLHAGKNGKSDFFGCSTYPKCKHIEAVNSK